VAYLLVPPAVIVMFVVTFARRLRSIPTPQLLVGLMCAAGFAVFAYLQFGYTSVPRDVLLLLDSMGRNLFTLAVILAELCRSSQSSVWLDGCRPWSCCRPLCYEVYPQCCLRWLRRAALGGVPSSQRSTEVHGRERPRRSDLRVASGTAVPSHRWSLLVLTVAPSPVHRRSVVWPTRPTRRRRTRQLSWQRSLLIDWYQVSAELPSFVGNATYRGEQLLMWWPTTRAACSQKRWASITAVSTRFEQPRVITTQDAAMLA